MLAAIPTALLRPVTTACFGVSSARLRQNGTSFLIMAFDEENTHVLERKWALSEQYFIDNKIDRRRGYEKSFELLCVIGTLETFWSYWRVLPAIACFLGKEGDS